MSWLKKLFEHKEKDEPKKFEVENVLVSSVMPKYCNIGNLIFEGKHNEAIQKGASKGLMR
ncbi:hypothetical protein HQ45_06785 [Porphyromonas crevioricanis]|uniref:Uncharacterized protein n=2 Tax=Porphyromonas crevioricanis TaxID=393921 RepID=A0A0A2FHT4_9PORP|nr:hypothetical protein [Porphyromonas crevioricanis]KGN89687.1 hypothetical protein HQ45_06785 [Porphyromonas crevioricanis]SJZ77859.1 hypothetical protein SAMN02745203_00832 [Porphyromonas crevioricanis]SQH72370.1 Uncharacterised protein [Porphyromonas crevioricanis]GAD04516.1 hypothetical protein PORCRE_202 [Porphyromonas crevioricanis JCM 15906]GAD07912.1 hypothetical protein PORCAN_1541 [Porphyromonas crevioricanis JCM 13913]